jgi:hypothetical protein
MWIVRASVASSVMIAIATVALALSGREAGTPSHHPGPPGSRAPVAAPQPGGCHIIRVS